jgi:hypothetical protein
VPTSGRYYLYFDFQVDSQVHSAAFVVDADTEPTPEADAASESESEGHGH